MDGYRVCLERAIRVEDGIDWSVHSIDYALFKKRLLFFSRRRSRLRGLLRNSPDQKIAESTLVDILGPTSHVLPQRRQQFSSGPMLMGTDGYIPFVESSGSMDASVPMVPTHIGESSDQSTQSGLFRGVQRLKKIPVMRRVSNAERNELSLFLSSEVDKVTMFYMAQWQRLSQSLVSHGATVALGDEIMELLAHVATNIITVRQILIRYDAFALTFDGTPFLHYYMKKVTKEHRRTSFRKLLHHEELKALADSFGSELIGRDQLASHMEYWERFEAQQHIFEVILESSQEAESLSATGFHQVELHDTCIHTFRHYFLLGAIEDNLGLEPTYLTLRGKSLLEEIQKIAEWREQRDSCPLRAPSVRRNKVARLSKSQVFALGLNLVAVFLYCINYYIVEPSSVYYAIALGAHDTMSGMLIGMMPLAAFSSALFLSLWTNVSFRYPLLMSSILLMVGNLLYSSAYEFRSFPLALAGRFITGLGGPKVIVRRYIADTTPVRLRTTVNAAFGMMVAVGSALGPALAIVLNKIDFEIPFLARHSITVNGLTGPGYFMASLWSAFFVVVLCTFGEPRREGLEEQKQLEASMLPELTTPSHLPSMQEDAVAAAPGKPVREDDLMTIFSGEPSAYGEDVSVQLQNKLSWFGRAKQFMDHLTLPVRICLGLLFAKTFTIETLVSATSALTKNRYGWTVEKVGTLGCVNGILVVPLSVLVGRLSTTHQDRILMSALVSVGCFGMFLLVDLSDLVHTPTDNYNRGHPLAVGTVRYVLGYFLAYISVQAFEGVIGSTLSKVIPVALASGTLNSGLLATLVDTLGRASGDLFISLVGSISLRQLMNLLFIPGFAILLTCLIVIRRYYDILAV